MNCLFGYWNQLWLILMSTRKLKFFPRKVIMFICRRNVSSAPRWTHYHFVFLGITFHVDYEMYSCQYGNYPYEKYLRLEEDKQLWFFKINARVEYCIQNVRFLNDCVLFISTMICFAFNGKNDRCWIVKMFWDTFNIEIFFVNAS